MRITPFDIKNKFGDNPRFSARMCGLGCQTRYSRTERSQRRERDQTHQLEPSYQPSQQTQSNSPTLPEFSSVIDGFGSRLSLSLNLEVVALSGEGIVPLFDSGEALLPGARFRELCGKLALAPSGLTSSTPTEISDLSTPSCGEI